LGQIAHLEGDQENAVFQLTKAIRVNKDFELAYLELGYAYADRGDFPNAECQLAILEAKNSNKATTLQSYITLATQPQITSAQSSDGFSTSLGPKTKISALNSTLTSANKSKLFSMNIAFSKDMDEASIINPYNWKISRATIRDNGGVYNGGLTPSNKEAVILPSPAYVNYNSETNKATVYFRLSQNTTADATIDPQHIVFKFSGIDTYGKAMDTSADEYSGFSKIV
jgi:tetratricopeptide (TPR) repeat protein